MNDGMKKMFLLFAFVCISIFSNAQNEFNLKGVIVKLNGVTQESRDADAGELIRLAYDEKKIVVKLKGSDGLLHENQFEILEIKEGEDFLLHATKCISNNETVIFALSRKDPTIMFYVYGSKKQTFLYFKI